MTPEDGATRYTIGEAARLLGVSARTLRHWEAEGVVEASERSFAGYRLYSRTDIARLQRALVYRETGMPLADIAELLDSPRSPIEHLRRQRSLLEKRIEDLQSMIASIDALIEKKEHTMTTPEEDAEELRMDWGYEDEARERWGGTEDWEHARRRRAARGEEGEAAAAAKLDAVEAELAEAFREGVEAGSQRANELVERHRASLDWFEVTREKHLLLARMYASDPRFTAHYDEREPGLAAWLKEAVEANARAHGVDPDRAEWR